MTDSKPCVCGSSDCHVVRREGEKPSRFALRSYGSDACLREARAAAGAKSSRAKPLDDEKPSDLDGALVTNVAWLDLPPVRLRLLRQMEGR
jgi:hypothetical protein